MAIPLYIPPLLSYLLTHKARHTHNESVITDTIRVACCRRNQIGTIACSQYHCTHNIANAIPWCGNVLNVTIHHMANVVNRGGERTCHACHIAAWLKGTAIRQFNSVGCTIYKRCHFKSHLIRVVGNFYVVSKCYLLITLQR